jgi:hypothetical protein
VHANALGDLRSVAYSRLVESVGDANYTFLSALQHPFYFTTIVVSVGTVVASVTDGLTSNNDELIRREGNLGCAFPENRVGVLLV